MAYVGDIGFRIEFDTKEANIEGDIKVAKIYHKKPGKKVGVWECSIDDGSIYYDTKEGDLDIAGIYQLQPYIETSSFKGMGDPTSLEVLDILK